MTIESDPYANREEGLESWHCRYCRRYIVPNTPGIWQDLHIPLVLMKTSFNSEKIRKKTRRF